MKTTNRRVTRLDFASLVALIVYASPSLSAVDAGSENTSAIYSPASVPNSAREPIVLKPGPHLLLDEFLIESSSNISRRVNMPVRDPAIPNPIVTGNEDGCFQPYLTVIRDPRSGRFRLWYGVHTPDFNTGRSHIGYLESEDGIRWLRPHRVLTDPASIQFGVSVIDEGPGFPKPAERFRFAWHEGGLKIAVSPDGFAWTPLSPKAVLEHNHDINGIFWDPLRKQYVATVSFYITGPDWKGTRRITKHSTSTNLLHWSEPWPVITPDDKLDEGETQFYAMDGYHITYDNDRFLCD